MIIPRVTLLIAPVPPNEELIIRIRSALSEIESCGDLMLLSASLYYGDELTYSKLDLSELIKQSWSNYLMIDLGKEMILELPDAERVNLRNSEDKSLIDPETYKQQINQWIEKKGIKLDKYPKVFPVSTSVELLDSYVTVWNARRYVRHFYTCGRISSAFNRALEIRAEIESTAKTVRICSIAVEVLQEYDIYISHWKASCAHKKRERQIANNNHKKFYNAIVERDGEFCAKCHTVSSLVLDHVIPITKGGMSILNNLQLLCSKCNSAKNKEIIDYRTGISRKLKQN